MEEFISYNFTPLKENRYHSSDIEYELKLRQQPKQSRMCGVGEKADRRPIDPPPIIQLKIHDKAGTFGDRNYFQNSYYFMYASLMNADLDEEIHLLQDGKTRSTTGSVVSSLYHLKDTDNTDSSFFVFPDLSVRIEGIYRLKFSLFEIVGKGSFHCKFIISDTFSVYSAKRFPGMEESTFLSRTFANQGLKLRIRKEPRHKRKKQCSEDHAPEKQKKVNMSSAQSYWTFQNLSETLWCSNTISPISDPDPSSNNCSSYRRGSQSSLLSSIGESNSQNSNDQRMEFQEPYSYVYLTYHGYPAELDQISSIYQNKEKNIMG